MLVDGTSVVDESNWLDIDADHLGAEPLSAVGVSIISDGDYTHTHHQYSQQLWLLTVIVMIGLAVMS